VLEIAAETEDVLMNDEGHVTYGQAEPLEGVSGFSVEPALTPTTREDDVRVVNLVQFQFRDHHGFEKRLVCGHLVNSNSRVFVSICEVGVFGNQWKPFQGLASMEVHNVVPHDDGIVIVRGHIGWDADLNVRLNVFVA